MKKLIAMLISIIALVAFIPAFVLADGEGLGGAPVATYTVDENITADFYQLTDEPATYLLKISGTGTIPANFGSLVFSQGGSSYGQATTKVLIENGITGIGDHALIAGYFTKLEEVSLPTTLTSIGDYAFANNSHISTIVIPDSVETIGAYSFYGCVALTSIQIDQTTSRLTNIGSNAFYNCPLPEITLPNSLEVIQDHAFYTYGNQYVLTTVNIDKVNSHLTTIGDYAFADNKALAVFNFPASLQSIGDHGFAQTAITTADLSGVTSLGTNAFYNCQNLTTVVLSDSLTRLENGVFTICIRLSSINLPRNLTYIGNNTFDGCWAIADINKDLVIPSGVTHIGDAAFASCRFESISLPQRLDYLGSSAFRGNNFTEVTLPAGLSEIPAAFSDMPTLERFYISDPDAITSIANTAFMGCTNLQVGPDFIPHNVTRVGDQSFQGCEKITTINIPSSVTYIGQGAFGGCINLETFNIPEDSDLTALGTTVFYNCEKLTTLRIPSGVTTINQQCFENCPGLTTVYITDNTTTINQSAFSNDLAYAHEGYHIYIVPAPGHRDIDPSLVTVSNGGLVLDEQTGLYYLRLARNGGYTENYRCILTYSDYNYDDDFVCANLIGHSLSLDGDIGVNFYLEINTDAFLADSAYMVFEVNEKDDQIVSLSSLSPMTVNGRANCYRFTCRVAAKQMTDTITATFHYTALNGEEKAIVYTYSVADYAYYLIDHRSENTQFSNASYLVKTMLAYGTAAQLYFDYNTDNLPDSSYCRDLEIGSSSWFNKFRYVAPASLPEGVTFYGASLVLESTTTLKMYFIVPEGTDLTFTYNGRTITPETEGNYTVIRIANISAPQLPQDVQVTLSDGEGIYTVSYKPLTYCYLVYNAPEGIYPDSLRLLISMLVAYGNQAYSYHS